MKRLLLISITAIVLGLIPCAARPRTDDAELTRARTARNRGDLPTLRQIIVTARKAAEAKPTSNAYVRLALLYTWLCEAIESGKEASLFKKAAEDGVAAAEKAVALDPASSQAHQLLGDLMNQLIPHVNGGGMRYGKRATDELDKAIQLDPKNADAYVSRAISYYYSPESFGGNKPRALEMLQKAIEIGTARETPHIWLAMFYLDSGKKKEAIDEITIARSLDPERGFTNAMYGYITKGK